MIPKKDPRQVFAAPKTHSKLRNIRLAIEILILIVVTAGTILSLLAPGNFSFQKGLENLRGLVGLKKQNLVQTEASFEERVASAVDKKILNITSLEKSTEGFVTIKSAEEVTVVLSSQKDLDSQTRTLQTVLSKAKIEGREVSLVDFRFDKIVVRYR